MNLTARTINGLMTVMSFLLFLDCQSQTNNNIEDGRNSSSDSQRCNQEVYGTKKYIKELPQYICLPSGFIIDDYVRTSDLNGDAKNDFLAVKYNQKEDNQTDGDTTYWDFYLRNVTDTIYSKIFTLDNIVPLFLKSESLDYLSSHPEAAEIYRLYPRRLKNRNLSFNVKNDTLKLSYKFDDTYGKTFVFLYDRSGRNWYLDVIQYFIGELPRYWWENNDFYFPLRDDIKVIESAVPVTRVSIDGFNLVEAFKFRETEWTHLAEWHIDNIDEAASQSILDANFERCNGMDLPADRVY